ncbi:PATS1-like protein [Mya arenaria]|uniref:PATS1-like protein n=1 Tax=Mya arenaria TaxID=6604 RepID=A0ABY7G2J7_MYAAR|nr:PATS1-like protein [Mya arenaria]
MEKKYLPKKKGQASEGSNRPASKKAEKQENTSRPSSGSSQSKSKKDVPGPPVDMPPPPPPVSSMGKRKGPPELPPPPPPPPSGLANFSSVPARQGGSDQQQQQRPAILAHPAPKTIPKVTSNDLSFGKAKLRKANKVKKLEDVERTEMFDSIQQYNYMPLLNSREYIRTRTNFAEVTALSFDGIEQMSDAFLFSLYHCQLSIETVNWISLTGCYNVTDEGIYWVSKTFSKLKSIAMAGCRKVTERSLHHLFTSLPLLQVVLASGTNIAYVPQDVPYRKLVILAPSDLPWSPLALLTGDKDVTPKMGLQFKKGWNPYEAHKIEKHESGVEIFNILQVTPEEGFLELVVSQGSLIVIPYHLHGNLELPAVPKSGAVGEKDLEFLSHLLNLDLTLHPWNNWKLAGDKVMKISEKLAKSEIPLMKVSNLPTEAELFVSEKSRLMDLAVLWGHGLKLKANIGGSEEELISTDFNWLMEIVNKLLTAPAPRSCDLCCLGDKTLLLEMLKEKGYLLTFPIDVWSSMKDVSFVYVRYSDLPKAAPELMKQYWPDNDNIGPRVKQKEKFYFCAPGLPQTFFATLLREMFALGPPTLAWQTGALFLRTYLTVLVEIYPHVSDKYQVIVLQIRGNASSSTFPQDPLWTTLKLYSNIIDMMMMINTIPAVKAVMCSKCKDKSSAEELLSKFVNWKGHFLMEFLVREEHHLRCGISLSTADLVPNHDQKGCALGTTNPLNRCLMCQNCAKTAAILEPKFDPLSKGSYAQDQMIADDKVKVTEKGSMYGFIEVDTIKTLDRSVLTPNYSPNMEVTLLSEGFFGLDLAAWERRGQGPIGVHYYSKSGVSKTNIKGVDKVGTPMPCNHGDTISIALRYKEELFENMQLTLKLNGTTFFELDLGATQVTVTICNNESESVFLQVQTPGKLINLLDGMEFVCFGGKGISLSGSPCVVMPEEKTLGMLKHPTWSTYKDVRIHHMCLTWNASLSKKTVLGPSSHKETPSQLPPFGDRIKSGEWAMSKLVHLIDNEGINPILLPETTDQLLGPGIVNEHNIDQVKEGLRHLLKAGMWLHYSRIDLDHLRKSFAVQGSGGKIFKGEFLTTKNELVRTSTKTGYMVVTSKFNRNLELYLCPGHKHTMINKTGLEEIPKNLYGKYSLFVTFIDLQHNDLTHLPKEFFENLPNVTHIAVGHNFIQNLPSTIGCCKKLLSLQIHENNISKLPDTFADLKLLQTLDIGNNCFPEFPPMITKITSLTRLLLHNSFFTGQLSLKITRKLQRTRVEYTGSTCPATKKRLPDPASSLPYDWNSLFSMFDENQNGVLDAKEVGKLNATVFNLFPRFGYKGNEPPDEDMPHGFPMQICSCKKLEVLYLKCQGITRVPPEIRQLEKLIDLQLSHNPNLISIPAELSELSRLKKLELDDCPMLKTPPREIRDKGVHSIMGYLKSLMSGDVLSIDIKSWEVKHEDETITYNMWDFAGQTVYYNTHQFFLSPNRAIYLLLWNVRLGHEHAGLDFWLNSICVQAPKAPVFVIGSHIDQVSKSELPLEEMQQKFPQVVGFHFVSSFTGQGIAELKKHLFEVSLQQPYMGEHIPSVWLEFEKNIQLVKRNADIIAYTEMEKLAYKCGLFEPSEDGRLKHDDVGEIWSNYGKGLHSWLLRLTEEFDLTFELPEEKINLVPCLLPEAKPKFEWPVVEKGSDIRETKMVYTFDYLPVGLFNRAQVRLHGLSDKSLIWKKGSFLKKNVHLALIQQTKDTEMVVIAQGPRPDNIQFLVHEIFEGLISESFHGITYDFTMPCPECQKMGVKDGHMFSASTIRRALEMKAPFLQCVRYFHTISCVTLQTLLPPDNQSDFDLHLVQCVQGLQDLHKELTADEACVNIFKYARRSLNKTIVIVAIGDDFGFEKTRFGILIPDEVYINMTKPKLTHYDTKFDELVKTLNKKMNVRLDELVKPAVFFSYSWVNSQHAVSLGTREIPGALGEEDPRELKTYLESNGIPCWIDEEQIGMNGLIEDIAEGLLCAKVVVVCVSDEYAVSKLKLPPIFAVVGSGDSWRETEIGYVSVQHPVVYLQEHTKNSRKKLLKLVREKLASSEGTQDRAEELFELAQRKLSRQLMMFAENQDLDIYPRLFVVDFVKEQMDAETDEESIEEKFEKEDIAEKKKLGRPMLKRQMSRKSTNMIPLYKLQKFCVYTLCEHDEGWHSVAEPIELPASFGVESLEGFGPYLARITTVMKFNKRLPLNCLAEGIGEGYIEWLERSPEANLSDYQNVYHTFREMFSKGTKYTNQEESKKQSHQQNRRRPRGKKSKGADEDVTDSAPKGTAEEQNNSEAADKKKRKANKNKGGKSLRFVEEVVDIGKSLNEKKGGKSTEDVVDIGKSTLFDEEMDKDDGISEEDSDEMESEPESVKSEVKKECEANDDADDEDGNQTADNNYIHRMAFLTQWFCIGNVHFETCSIFHKEPGFT